MAVAGAPVLNARLLLPGLLLPLVLLRGLLLVLLFETVLSELPPEPALLNHRPGPHCPVGITGRGVGRCVGRAVERSVATWAASVPVPAPPPSGELALPDVGVLTDTMRSKRAHFECTRRHFR